MGLDLHGKVMTSKGEMDVRASSALQSNIARDTGDVTPKCHEDREEESGLTLD